MKNIVSMLGSALLLFLALTVFTPDAMAASGGIMGRSGRENSVMTCALCHQGGAEPIVALSGPASLEVGETATYMLTITSTSASQTAAGLGVAVTNGFLLNLDDDTRVDTDLDELTHTQPKTADTAGITTFSFEYTAPDSPQPVRVFYAGNAVNQASGASGDGAVADQFIIDIVASPTSITLNQASSVDGQAIGLLGSMLGVLLVGTAVSCISFKRA